LSVPNCRFIIREEGSDATLEDVRVFLPGWSNWKKQKLEPMIGTILWAEDRQEDVFIIQRAFQEARIARQLFHVSDGVEVTEFLKGEGPYVDRKRFPFPEILVLDLKMPRMGGLEVLSWLKERPEGKVLPAVLLTESIHDPDIRQAYELGAKTIINKPVSVQETGAALKQAASFCMGGPAVPLRAPFIPPPPDRGRGR
jgi:two-component system response regulator